MGSASPSFWESACAGDAGSDATLDIALAQVDTAPRQPAANLDKIVGYADQYADQVDLLAFPEYATCGHGLGEAYFDLALRTDGPAFERLLEASHRTAMAVGFVEENDDFHLHNSLAILRGGLLQHVHRKIYLQNYGIFEEKKYFAAGDDYETVALEEFRVAPLICGDAWNPALFHLGALGHAHAFLISTCSPAGGLGDAVSSERNWKRLIRLFATIYGSYVLFVNRAGSDGGTDFWGGSEVVDPFGETVVSSDTDTEEVLHAEIELERVRRARRLLFTTRDARPDFLRRQLASLDE